mmetsp:Transcript_4255/g.4935  ORF Transcript_4255/g.4935 Transcript_4255/m.4935 type:complete len:108 (+) Transcript_4255:213-536(+)
MMIASMKTTTISSPDKDQGTYSVGNEYSEITSSNACGNEQKMFRSSSSRRVRFSEMPVDRVHFIEKVALKDITCLWYGCHELQKMIDEHRSNKLKENDETTAEVTSI